MAPTPTNPTPFRYIDEDGFCLSARLLPDLNTGRTTGTLSITIEGSDEPQSVHVPVKELPTALEGIAGAAGLEQARQVFGSPTTDTKTPVPVSADLPDRLEAVLTERFTALGNPFSAMRRQEKGPDGWPAEHPVGPAGVAGVLRELLATEAQQPAPAAPETMLGASGCTCIPWTRQGGVPRFLGPGDTVDQIGGWQRALDCPHHASPRPCSHTVRRRPHLAHPMGDVHCPGYTTAPAVTEEPNP